MCFAKIIVGGPKLVTVQEWCPFCFNIAYISRDLVESLHSWVIYSLNEENINYKAKADDEIEVFYVCKVWYVIINLVLQAQARVS